MKENMFLKVMAIIMLIGGILGAIISIIPAAISVLGALADLKLIYMLILIVATIFAVVGAVLQILAGVKGLAAAKDSSKAPECVKLGILIVALCLVSNVLSWIAPNGSVDIVGLLTNLVVPGLYTYSAMQK